MKALTQDILRQIRSGASAILLLWMFHSSPSGCSTPPSRSVLKDDGILISLIKPQFEVGREHIKKGGIVRDKDSHVRAIMSLFRSQYYTVFILHELMKSPVKGGDGNTEYLALFRKKPEIPEKNADTAFVKEVVYGV